jgi:hypothetical protein
MEFDPIPLKVAGADIVAVLIPPLDALIVIDPGLETLSN